jgi:catechol 2,3-dioxygenase-like lactoylglutathione lyase family enzyme
VIDHVGLGVSDLEQSKAFYQQALRPLGYQLLMERDGSAGFGRNGKPDLWIHVNRPLAWCEAHHLRHWLHGGPTDLANLALLCRIHHRAVHEGGWRLARGPDGRLTATPPHRAHRRHRVAA